MEQGTLNRKSNLEKKEQNGGITLPNCTLWLPSYNNQNGMVLA